MEHGIATHMNYTCKIYSMTSENGMSYCVCQIHVLGYSAWLSSLQPIAMWCSLTLYSCSSPQKCRVFLRLGWPLFVCNWVTISYILLPCMHINITVGLNSKFQPSTHMIASATGKGQPHAHSEWPPAVAPCYLTSWILQQTLTQLELASQSIYRWPL